MTYPKASVPLSQHVLGNGADSGSTVMLRAVTVECGACYRISLPFYADSIPCSRSGSMILAQTGVQVRWNLGQPYSVSKVGDFRMTLRSWSSENKRQGARSTHPRSSIRNLCQHQLLRAIKSTYTPYGVDHLGAETDPQYEQGGVGGRLPDKIRGALNECAIAGIQREPRLPPTVYCTIGRSAAR